MTHLSHTAHLPFVSFWVGGMGWLLTGMTIGLIQWRVWYVADVALVTSGVAWVGIWRACFHSRVLVTSELETLFCQGIGFSESFTPTEISVAQALLLTALVVGVGGNATAVYALRNVYFGLGQRRTIRLAFSLAGVLYLLAGVCSLIPLAWNMRSVVANQTIDFPANFHLPPAPLRQEVGGAIGLGITASLLEITCGLVFLSYRLPKNGAQGPRIQPFCENESSTAASNATVSVSQGPTSIGSGNTDNSPNAWDNPTFHSGENGDLKIGGQF